MEEVELHIYARGLGALLPIAGDSKPANITFRVSGLGMGALSRRVLLTHKATEAAVMSIHAGRRGSRLEVFAASARRLDLRATDLPMTISAREAV